MSVRKFLAGLRDVTSSENIDKVENANDAETTSRLLSHTVIVSCSPEHLSVSDESREVAVRMEDYIAKKLETIRKLLQRTFVWKYGS